MRFIFLIFIVFFCSVVTAQRKFTYDSTKMEHRDFAPSSIDAYSKNKDFQYEKEKAEQPSVWDRFWDWVWSKYDDMMNTPTGRTTMKLIYWLIGVAAVVFFGWKVIKMNRINLFTASSNNTVAYLVDDENIHLIAFDDAINDALQNGNYRLAIRLLYLQNLKILTDKNYITWLPHKTNRDYCREINLPGLQRSFKNITDVFEYVWYGDFKVGREDYIELKEAVSAFQTQL